MIRCGVYGKGRSWEMRGQSLDAPLEYGERAGTVRIERGDTIRIAPEKARQGTFGRLQTGDIVPGRIIERTGPRQALIDIGGGRVTAEFTGGVPREGRVMLMLSGRDGPTLLFSRIRKDDPRFYRDLFRMTAFDPARIGRRELTGILAGLRRGASGLFDLSSVIARALAGKRAADMPRGGLSHALSALGVGDAERPALSFLLASVRSRHLPLGVALFTALGGDRNAKLIDSLVSAETAEGASALLKPIEDALAKDEDAPRRFAELARGILPGAGDEGDVIEGEFAFDENGPRSLRYVAGGAGCALSFELSRLGRLEVLVREHGDAIRCVIVCENDDARAELAGRAGELVGTLSGSRKGEPVVDIYKRSDIAEKIIEIYASFTIHSVFDARV